MGDLGPGRAGWKAFGQDLAQLPAMQAWSERIEARPAVKAAAEKGEEMRRNLADHTDEAEAARKVLFGQRARA